MDLPSIPFPTVPPPLNPAQPTPPRDASNSPTTASSSSPSATATTEPTPIINPKKRRRSYSSDDTEDAPLPKRRRKDVPVFQGDLHPSAPPKTIMTTEQEEQAQRQLLGEEAKEKDESTSDVEMEDVASRDSPHQRIVSDPESGENETSKVEQQQQVVGPPEEPPREAQVLNDEDDDTVMTTATTTSEASPATTATTRYRRRPRRKSRKDRSPIVKRTVKKKKTAKKDTKKRKRTKKKKIVNMGKKPKGGPAIRFDIRSRGYEDLGRPYNSFVRLANLGRVAEDIRRGHRFIVYNFAQNEIEYEVTFDTYEELMASERMNVFLHSVPFGKMLICIVNDSGFWRNNGTHEALSKFGAKKTHIGNRDSYALVTWSVPGCQPIFESTEIPGCGPTMFRQYLLESKLSELLKECSSGKKNKWVDLNASERRGVPEYILQLMEKFEQRNKALATVARDENAEKKDLEEDSDDDDYDDEDMRATEEMDEGIDDEVAVPDPNIDRDEICCASCGSTAYPDRMVFCSESCHANDPSWKSVIKADIDRRRREHTGSKQAFLETTLRPYLPDRGRAYHLWCAPSTQVCSIWHQYLIELAEKNGMDITDNQYMQAAADRVDEFEPISFDHARSMSKMVVGLKEKRMNMEEKEEKEVKENDGNGVVDDGKDREEDVEAAVNVAVHIQRPEQAPVFDPLNITLQDLSIFPKIFPPSFAYTCQFHLCRNLECSCGEPVVPQRLSEVEKATNRHSELRTIFCDICTMRAPKTDLWVFRCPDGINCKRSEDGYDVCMSCMIQKQRDSSSSSAGFGSCLCGGELTAIEADACFAKRKKWKELSNVRQFRCYCCQDALRMRDVVFGCLDESCLWKYQLCVPCYLTQDRDKLRCEECQHGLHCVYLEDVYMNEQAMEHYPLATRLEMREKGRRMKISKKLDVDSLNCDWTDSESEVESDHAVHEDPADEEPDENEENSEEELNQEPQGRRRGLRRRAKKRTKKNKKRKPKKKKPSNRNKTPVEIKSKVMGACVKCHREMRSNQFGFVCANKSHGFHMYCGGCALQGDPRDEAMQVRPLTPKADLDVEVVIVFVAHAGVTQVELWQKWFNELDESSRKRLGFAVQANNADACSYGTEFVEKYRIDLQRWTKWGKLVVVNTIQNSMQFSLWRFPNAKRFYFVSGSEIPVVSADKLLSMDNMSQMMFQDVTKRRVWRSKKLRNASWYCHHAAIVLVRKHVRLLAVAPISRYFKDSDVIISGVGAPDEFCWGTMLAAFGVKMHEEIWRDVTTDFEMPPQQTRHPVEFTSLDEQESFAHVDRNMKYIGTGKTSLRERCQKGAWSSHTIWGKGPCFFRKVAHSVDFGDFVPWRPGNAPSDWVDPDAGGLDSCLHDGSVDFDGYDSNGNLKEKLNSKDEVENMDVDVEEENTNSEDVPSEKGPNLEEEMANVPRGETDSENV